jgi:hypothetical protein
VFNNLKENFNKIMVIIEIFYQCQTINLKVAFMLFFFLRIQTTLTLSLKLYFLTLS